MRASGDDRQWVRYFRTLSIGIFVMSTALITLGGCAGLEGTTSSRGEGTGPGDGLETILAETNEGRRQADGMKTQRAFL